MGKSVLVIDTPENCYDCPFGTAYCGELEYVGLCELAECLGCNEILMTEKYDGDYPANMSDAGFVEGWNQCIDAIAGGDSDD